ncbi:hypothetical protein [Leptolyngbya sp. 7M]|uniref:hypothetical protein n=1 Tax=Leptolyngbya sp. 7M TaxID=2812896 RepID=UPI001B8BBC43|nr:hypothetical protein [Leptolyngbya sp. 7M]QYO64368.1 hypothetical protein JVX88_32530 [Leptolyngbya sp. 7M]
MERFTTRPPVSLRRPDHGQRAGRSEAWWWCARAARRRPSRRVGAEPRGTAIPTSRSGG